ncbi:MAG: hypothetical protein ACI4AO_08460, partial [Anaerotignum sp.]
QFFQKTRKKLSHNLKRKHLFFPDKALWNLLKLPYTKPSPKGRDILFSHKKFFKKQKFSN